MKNLLYILIFFTLSSEAQSIDLTIYQDAKLGLIGDNRGNEAGTLNIITRLKMNGMQLKNGYVVGFPEFEYANIAGIYKRYSLNMGYTYNKLFIDNVEASIYGGWGFIDRYGKSFFSAGASFELAYIINKVKLTLLGQFTERKDLAWLWGTNEIRFSGFVGIQYQIFKR